MIQLTTKHTEVKMNNQEQVFNLIIDCVLQSFNETIKENKPYMKKDRYIDENNIFSSKREQVYVKPRAAAIYMLRVFTSMGVMEIGKKFNRTHSSIIHLSSKTHEGLYISNELYRYQVNYAIHLFMNHNTPINAVDKELRDKLIDVFELKSKVDYLISITLQELTEKTNDIFLQRRLDNIKK